MNEADELLIDAHKLVRHLRQNGQSDDADRLEQRIATATKVFGSLALLAGGYYVGVKLRAGRLLLAWGWGATGEQFARVAGRLERLLPEAENAINEVLTSAKPHVPPAGSGIDWRVLDQVVNGTVPAQLDGAACGPACLAMVLAERGIKLTQEELIRRARATIHPEIKSKRITAVTLQRLLARLDPAGGWTGGDVLGDDILRGRNARQVIELLARRGPWIAQVGVHFIVVDGFDAAGNLRIRDPWDEPGRIRGINSGSSYRVSLQTFIQNWYAVAIFRK